MSSNPINENVLEEIESLNRENGTGRVTFGHFLYLLERITPRTAEEFQFGKGGSGSNSYEPLDGVEAGRKAKVGVVITNVDAGLTVMAVTTNDKANPGGSPPGANGSALYLVPPGNSVELNITEPDRILVAGVGSGLSYTWFAR